MAKNKTQKDETIVDVVEVYSNAERYIDENQKSLSIIIIAIVCIVGGFFAYKKLRVRLFSTGLKGRSPDHLNHHS